MCVMHLDRVRTVKNQVSKLIHVKSVHRIESNFVYILGTRLLFAIGREYFNAQFNVLPKIGEVNPHSQDSNEG